MIYGLDYLGLAQYPKVALRSHPTGMAVGAFSYVEGFGDSLPAIRELAASGKVPRFRIHCAWADDHNYTSSYLPTIIKEAKRIEEVAKEFPGIEWRISGACEHRLGIKDTKELASLVKKHAPSCLYVNSPWDGALLLGEINEVHGHYEGLPPPGRFDFSFDGTPAEDSNITNFKKKFNAAETFYIWSPRFNGRWESTDITPRPNRKGWPDKEMIESMAYLATDRGKIKLAANWIWKSHAENKGTGDKRAEKPVLLMVPKAEKVQLVTTTDKIVAEAIRYPEPFGDGRNRYYFTEWGYKIAEKAIALQGHPILRLKYKGKLHGKINPGFRINT